MPPTTTDQRMNELFGNMLRDLENYLKELRENNSLSELWAELPPKSNSADYQ